MMDEIITKRIENYKKTDLIYSEKEKNRIKKCLMIVKNDEDTITKRMIIEKAKIHNLI
jgi:hypothetical protein